MRMPASILRAVAAAALAIALPVTAALDSLRIVIPDAAGSSLDATGRELGAALVASGAVKNLRYENLAGADGTVALARFVADSKGDPRVLLLGDHAMAQGIVRHRAANTFANVTPVARLSRDSGSDWRGVFAAPAITKAQRDELAGAVQQATRSSMWREAMRQHGWQDSWLPGDEFGKFAESQVR